MSFSPRQVYRRLYQAYGPQGWWPVAPRGRRVPAYDPQRGRLLSEEQRVEVCLGAVLTQNTAWTNVQKALLDLRGVLPRFSWEGLWNLSHRRLSAAVRSSGYFRQKAKKLKILAKAAARNGGDTAAWLKSGDLQARRNALLALWGIGPETADSILLYAVQRPAFVVDVYTRRIGRRLGWSLPDSYDGASAFFTSRLPKKAEVYAEFHALIVRLAKEHCRVKPDCKGCPLSKGCVYANER